MTTHNDQHDVETRLRASLRERAGDVDTTPVLYERVQRQATRGQWVRRGFALAAAAAVVAGAFAVVPGLLPDQPLQPGVLEEPEDTAPGDATPTEEAPGEDSSLTGMLLEAGVAHAVDDGSGGSIVHVGDRTVRSARQVVSLTTASSGASTVVVAGRADGSIGGINVGDTGDEFDQLIDADANGGRAVPTPGADGVAWFEGTDLHLLPLADGAAVRVLPLEGDVPDDLRIEQWFAQADAQVILASDPDGGLWSIPMDDSDVFDTAPTDPAFVLDEAALDGALLPTLATVTLQPSPEGVVLAEGDDLRSLPTELPTGTDLTLTTNDVGGLTVVDRETGTGFLLELVDGALGAPVTGWQDPQITAAVQVVVLGSDAEEADEAGDRASTEAHTLGLRTDAPVIATDGVGLVIRAANGTTTRRDVYEPVAESEAVLGDLAVRPGSTPDDGLVAVESSSEGETSVRFAKLEGDAAAPVGDILVTDGEVTGLVWSEDGTVVAWTDSTGLHVATVEGDGAVAGEPTTLYDDTRPVFDWIWTDDDGSRTSGLLAVRVGEGGTEFLGVDRFGNGEHVATQPGGGGDRLFLDTHANPGAAVGPDVSAAVNGRVVELFWGADADRFGDLPDPGPYDFAGAISVEVSGGQVIVMSADGAASMVTFDGEVIQLPPLTDWDVLD